jgi:hypothetical protein
MPMTHSGVLVTPGNGVAPPLVDIALGLSRQPRFGGQTRRWWSVLDHSLFVADLAAREGRGLRVILALLLHDAHEALTGDIPTSLKTDDMRDVQASLDERIMREYFPGGAEAYLVLHGIVKAYDRRALLAEARLVGPPPLGEKSAEDFRALFGGLPRQKDCDVLDELLLNALVGREEIVRLGVAAPNVRQYVEMCVQLRHNLLP